MVMAKDLEDGFDLDRIDAEIKIEKIRQTASKLSWDGFHQALRRNLMEKRFIFDTEGRIDLLQAISTIRRNLPVDKNAELPVRLKQLSDSLECVLTLQQGAAIMKNNDITLEFTIDGDKVNSCKIGYFGKSPVSCDDAVQLIRDGDFGKLRSKLFSVMATIPSNLTAAEKNICVNASDAFEGFLSASCGTSPSFESIGTLPYGFLLFRTPLRPARVFYTVEPSYVVTKKRPQLELPDFDILDHLELSIVSLDKELQLPAGDSRNPWSTVATCKAGFQLRFSSPMLFSYGMWRRLERHLARPAAVKENVNLYRYMSGFKFEQPELVMRTCFPEPYRQHWYTVCINSLLDEEDCVISEICIGNGSDLAEIVSIVRAQAIHNSLWESLLAMSSGKWKEGQPHVDIRIVPSAARFELSFCVSNKMYLARVELTREFEWIGSVEDSNGVTVRVELNSLLTTRINATRSIPVAMVRVLKELGCEDVHSGGSGASDQAAMEVDNESCVSGMDKVGSAWLPLLNRSKETKKPPRPYVAEFTFEVHSVPLATPGGLLASYKEITTESGARPPAAARAEARTQRVQSDTALAISDLEAICQLADGMDDDNKTPTPLLSNRHSTSPVPSRPLGCATGSGPGSGVPQLSPLETARLKMTHSVGAAAAVGLASASTDVFEFADDRSVGSSSAYPSPSPQYAPFGTVGSPISGQSLRGTVTKRRPRARKTANMGDRMGDLQQAAGKDPAMAGIPTRKPRGKTGVRRPRGSRKAALAMTHAELEMQQRVPPPLQRSYSDCEPLSNPGILGVSTSPYVDTESDDECDPPPPPKSLGMFPSRSPVRSQVTAASAANSPSHSLSPLCVPVGTPSSSTHPPPSPLTATSPSVSQPAPIPSPRTSQPRKTSLDAVVGRLKTSAPSQSTPPSKRSVFNDLYDDGTESPPPPEERISAASTVASTPLSSTSVNASPLQSTTVTTQAGTSSPRITSEGGREQTCSLEGTQNTTPTVKIEGASKLILKIPKVPSRASPSVDAQKTKSIPMQAMPKLEKQEKKRDKEKKEGHKERSKDKSDESRRQKRKAEGKEKDREHKRHKTTSSTLDVNAAGGPAASNSSAKTTPTAPLPFGFVGSLKNFKIPKREEVKETTKEREAPPPNPVQPIAPTPPPLPTPAPNPPPLPTKASAPRKNPAPIPPPPMIPLPRQPLLGAPPSGPSGLPMGVGPGRKPPTLPDHRDRRPSMIGAPPFRGSMSSIPLPKGPPPPQATPTGGGTWIRPPSHIPTQNIRSPSPDPNAMQIDDDLNSPEDSLRIADD
ncbi:hypothetical protein GCK32_003987 [Trichostrongylus colubriformis]|uniref:Mediator complex subunit 1 n=1 Tax=Trichostrongylus colubriformis TaxID=6319 RepID=A0AAN8FA66_TRICO